MVTLLVAAALAAASPSDAPTGPPPNAAPAMFVIRDADTTIYIFGTFHALDGEAKWFDNQVRDAFEQSNELVLETLVPEGPAPAMRPLSMLSATPPASFLATTRMAINAGRAEGMQVDNGADMVLRRTAEEEGKPVEGLETLESQFAMFTKMPRTVEAAPRAGAPIGNNPMESLSKVMTDMQSAWKRGDQNVFVRMLGQLEQSSPTTYRMLFTERNTRWADWIR